jgi:hypothetical protein
MEQRRQLMEQERRDRQRQREEMRKQRDREREREEGEAKPPKESVLVMPAQDAFVEPGFVESGFFGTTPKRH